MTILKHEKYNEHLKKILKYIAKNNPANAKGFKKELDKKVLALPHMPYKFRKSIYFDNEQIRDLIYKGYTLPYLVDEKEQVIILLGIVKYREKF